MEVGCCQRHMEMEEESSQENGLRTLVVSVVCCECSLSSRFYFVGIYNRAGGGGGDNFRSCHSSLLQSLLTICYVHAEKGKCENYFLLHSTSCMVTVTVRSVCMYARRIYPPVYLKDSGNKTICSAE